MIEVAELFRYDIDVAQGFYIRVSISDTAGFIV
jgi:hypothetical protein